MKVQMILFAGFLGIFILYASPVFAQTPSLTISVSPNPTPTPTPVNYTLPYPGILADNPLYPLKTLRDNIIGWLISDPLKKTNFDLLQADKRLQIGVYLIQERNPSKYQLAISTISKGDNYMSEAIDALYQAKKQGEVTTDTYHKLHTAILKHEEVLTMLEREVDTDQKNILVTMRTHEQELLTRLSANK